MAESVGRLAHGMHALAQMVVIDCAEAGRCLRIAIQYYTATAWPHAAHQREAAAAAVRLDVEVLPCAAVGCAPGNIASLVSSGRRSMLDDRHAG